jgi:hypothetical protein
MSRFDEYIEGWKEKERFLELRLSSFKSKVWELLPVVAEKLKSFGAKGLIEAKYYDKRKSTGISQ